MKFQKTQTLEFLAELLGCALVGPKDFPISGLNEIHMVEPGDIVFVDHPKYYDKALESRASCVLIDKEVPCPEGKVLLVSEKPFADFNKLIKHFSPFVPANQMIDPDAKIGEGTLIQPGVFIGPDVEIGKNCLIHPGVILYGGTKIGCNVIIHSNSVIGADAFYYQRKPEGHQKFHSCGAVVIEDDVEIGAGSGIDRGVTGITRIGKGTKIDNQVMIGHDCNIGENCIFAAQVGVSGTVTVEDNVVLWGQVGIATGVTIGEGAIVLAKSGISKSLPGERTYFGTPAAEAQTRYRELASIRRIPKIMEQMRK